MLTTVQFAYYGQFCLTLTIVPFACVRACMRVRATLLINRCGKAEFLDGKYVVFGKVIDGLLVVRKIEAIPVGPNNNPKIPVTISQCGQM